MATPKRRKPRVTKRAAVMQDDKARLRAIENDQEDDGRGFPFRLQYAIMLAEQREGRRLHLTVLSREVDLHAQSLARHLNRSKRPTWESGKRIADRLKCGVGWLLFGGLYGRPKAIKALAGELH